jgi:hypothetical protein
MKFKSLKVGKNFVFLDKQVFENFSNFNLFIGKNSTGKTLALNLLSGLDFKFKLGSNNLYSPTNEKELSDMWYDKLENTSDSDYNGIYYEIEKNGETLQVELVNNPDNPWRRIITGDVTVFNNLEVIDPKVSVKDLILEIQNFCLTNKVHLPLLSFGFSYVFEALFSIQYQSSYQIISLIQKQPNSGDLSSISTLSSGHQFCLSVLMKALQSINNPVFIDEPDLNLEPRSIRRLFQFLAWLQAKHFDYKNEHEKNLCSSIEKEIDIWLEKFNEHHNKSFINKEQFPFPFYDPSIGYDDKIISVKNSILNCNLGQTQLFIASHSPILINEFMNFNNSASIYEFRRINVKRKYYHFRDLPLEAIEMFKKNGTDTDKNEFLSIGMTTINKINIKYTTKLLDDLGAKGSDILQTNGVIWVEGPSDVIYISKWLEMYAKEKNKLQFSKGRHFEFQMFGGTLLDSICLYNEGNNDEFKKLVEMFSFSRNAYVVTDSDAIIKSDKLVDQSTFKNAKNYIKGQLESMNNENLGMWYKEGDAEIRTIEDYIPENLNTCKAGTKKLKAQANVKSWDKEISLEKFNHGLVEEIKILYDTIERWNN